MYTPQGTSIEVLFERTQSAVWNGARGNLPGTTLLRKIVTL